MHRNRAVTQGIAACAVTAAALAGLSSATVPDIAEATSGTLRWGSCKDVEQKSGDAQQSKTPRQSGKNPYRGWNVRRSKSPWTTGTRTAARSASPSPG